MKLDDRLPDRGPGAPVRPGNDLAQLIMLVALFAAILAIWAVVMLVQAAYEPPAPDPRLANTPARSDSPANWVTPDDYPPAAIRNGEQGAVGVVFTVNVWGRVKDCRISTSSRSDTLDQTTCRLIERRARYTPARDGAGRAIEARKTLRFRWVLPE